MAGAARRKNEHAPRQPRQPGWARVGEGGATTDAGYSPGTHHNMPGELQATFQLSDHKWGAGVCALHLSFYETIIQNVSHRIKIADTPEELGR